MKQSLPTGEFQKPGTMGLSIRVGGYNEGVCVAGYRFPVARRDQLVRLLDGYRYAMRRAEQVMPLLSGLPALPPLPPTPHAESAVTDTAPRPDYSELLAAMKSLDRRGRG